MVPPLRKRVSLGVHRMIGGHMDEDNKAEEPKAEPKLGTGVDLDAGRIDDEDDDTDATDTADAD